MAFFKRLSSQPKEPAMKSIVYRGGVVTFVSQLSGGRSIQTLKAGRSARIILIQGLYG
jgi:hypothetical protein